MALKSVRDLAIRMASHLGPQQQLDEPTGYELPLYAKPVMVECINDAVEEMRVLCPSMFKQTLGVTWTPAATVSAAVTSGEHEITFPNGEEPDDGCTISLGGDNSLNEVRESPTEDGTYLLLHPYTGASGTVSATLYGDSVLLEQSVDRVLSGSIAHERRPLAVATSRDEWMRWMIQSFGRRDYGIYSAGRIDAQRQTGIPRAVWIDAQLDENDSRTRYRARCAPMPDNTYRATLEALIAPRAATEDDLADGADVYLPVPGNRYNLLSALTMNQWAGSAWFKNESARKTIAQNYAKAVTELREFSPDAGATVTFSYLR